MITPYQISPCYVFNSQIHTQRISPFLPSSWVSSYPANR